MANLRDYKHLFPAFAQNNELPLRYFDSAATCLTPNKVAMEVFQLQCMGHANSGRGLYKLSANASDAIELVRQKVLAFLNPKSDAGDADIVFTESATHSIHLVANGYLIPRIRKLQSDYSSCSFNLVISVAEHHANFIVWQQICSQFNGELRVAKLTPSGAIDVEHIETLVDDKTLLVSVCHVSNVLGVKNDVKAITEYSHKVNCKVLIDGAQAVGHFPINVDEIGCDFYAFSSHKMYGSFGCGALYLKESLLTEMEPVIYGGGIVNRVTEQTTSFLAGVEKLEAGSQNLAAIAGLGAAIDFIEHIGWQNVQQHHAKLSSYLIEQFSSLDFLKPILGSFQSNASLFSMNIAGVHSHDVASLLDNKNVAVRAGHHCAQPLHQYLAVKSSFRVSFGLYNTEEDVDQLLLALQSTHQLLGT